MKSSVDEVALQGIEFWSTVCDEEVDLAIEAAEVCRQFHSLHIIKSILVIKNWQLKPLIDRCLLNEIK